MNYLLDAHIWLWSLMEPDTAFIAATAWENDLILITEDEKLKESTQIKVFNEKRHPSNQQA